MRLSRNTRPQACRAEISLTPVKIAGTSQFQSHLTGNAIITEARKARPAARSRAASRVVIFCIFFFYFFKLRIKVIIFYQRFLALVASRALTRLCKTCLCTVAPFLASSWSIQVQSIRPFLSRARSRTRSIMSICFCIVVY